MSGTVRILSVLFAAVSFLALHYGLGIAWYLAGLAGIAVFWAFPICHEKMADRRSRQGVIDIRKRAKARDDAGGRGQR